MIIIQQIRNNRLNQLIQLIREKQDVVCQSTDITIAQSRCFEDREMDDVRFERLQMRKDEYILRMERLNNQTQIILDQEKDNLIKLIQIKDKQTDILHSEIDKLSELTEQLQQAELTVKALLETYFKEQREEIKQKRMQQKSAANYYKTMMKQYDTASYFYDKKN